MAYLDKKDKYYLAISIVIIFYTCFIPPKIYLPKENTDEYLEKTFFKNLYHFETVYAMGSIITGIDEHLLRAIAIVESNEKDFAIGDDGKSKGRMQINETWRASNLKKYGYYDPHNPIDAVVIGGFILKENYAYFNDWNLAIAAYRQGKTHVNKYGIKGTYTQKVMSMWEKLKWENNL